VKRRPAGPLGVPLPGTSHGTVHGYDKRGCRCAECVDAYRTYRSTLRRAKRGQEPPEHGTNGYVGYGCRCEMCRQSMRGHRERHRLAVNAETRAKAAHYGEEWTGPQLEIALDATKTAREAASQLGRTLIAVLQVRAKERRGDPRTVRLAGKAAS
jgi:hypothetical protein